MKISRHQRFALTLLLTALVAFGTACKTSKKAQPAPVTEAKPMQEKSVQELLDSLALKSFQQEWVNAKANVTTIQDGNETSFNITMRMKRDSVIWISISPLLGIEVARVMVTPDSVKYLDRLHGKYTVSSFETINKLLQLKVNFEIVQALLTGNFFAYKKNENRFNSVYLEDKYYILSSLTKHQLKRALEEKDPNKAVIQDVYVNEANFRILRMRVEDQKINKTLETKYEDFREVQGFLFPFKLQTDITADKNFEIRIDYGKVTAGESQDFPFSIPASYERSR